MAPSRKRTSFSSSAFACQSFQPQVTMVITSSRDRSLSRPALTCSHSRRCVGFQCVGFRQHVGFPITPLLPVSRDCKGRSVY